MSHSSSVQLVLFDSTSEIPERTWSPYATRVRMVLKHKKIPFRTEWIQFLDIQKKLKTIGFSPTTKRPNGEDLCTIPSLLDPKPSSENPTLVTDSAAIVRYLDETYPKVPIFPPHPLREHHDSVLQELESISRAHFVKLSVPAIAGVFNGLDGAGFRDRWKEQLGGVSLESLLEPDARLAAWKAAEEGWTRVANVIDQAQEKEGVNPGAGPFVFGETPYYVDICLVARLVVLRRLPVPEVDGNQKPWEVIKEWNGGRWAKMVAGLEAAAALD